MNEFKIKLVNKLTSKNYVVEEYLTSCSDLEFRTIYYKKCLEKGIKMCSVNLEFVELIFSEGREDEFYICELLNWNSELFYSKYRTEIYNKIKQEILRGMLVIHMQKIINYCIFSGDPEFIYFFIEYGIFTNFSVEEIISGLINLRKSHIPDSNVIKIICDHIFSITGSGEHFYKVLYMNRYNRNSYVLCIMIDCYRDSQEYCIKIYNYLQSSDVCIYFHEYNFTVSKENFILMSESIEKHKLNFLLDHVMLLSILHDSEYIHEIISRGYYILDD